jgi:tetratricopeptide (TPR) repeat protein
MFDLIRFSLCVLLAGVPTLAPGAGIGGPQSTIASPAPAGWDAAQARIRDLMFGGHYQEAMAAAEQVVASNPRFPDGHFWLGSAHENVARERSRTDPRRAQTHFETAAAELRQTWDLGGGSQVDAAIRGLIDLYEYALGRRDMWEAAIVDAAARFPAQPAAHWYRVRLALNRGRRADLEDAFRAARSGLRPEPPDGRLEFAGLIVGLARRSASTADRTALLTEARAVLDETLRSHPTDRFGQRAQSVLQDIARIPSK